MAKIRALVIEDSVTVRRRLVEVLSSDEQIEVVGEAEDGRTGIDLCQRLRPDVITLDMMLPHVNGQKVTEYVMAHLPTPILIVSSSTNRADLFKTYEALAAGALDVLEKPLGDDTDKEWERRFIARIKMISKLKVITHLRAKLDVEGRSPATPSEIVPPTSGARKYDAIAIGTSTGGPSAIVELLRALPDDFPIPVLFVLHIGEPFGVAFVDWLNGAIRHTVEYARHGDPLNGKPGRILMAPPDRHLIVRGDRVLLTSAPERNFCRPSVDVLFESVAAEFGPNGVGCLLTGMGRDGAAGLLQIRRAGGTTLAQDESTSVVYGMPREAALLGAVEHVLPLFRIGPALAALGARRLEIKP
jgi:two-component system chemotaxis response regulator CheB